MFIEYNVNTLRMKLQQKYVENQEDKNCQWSGIKVNITDRIVLY